MIIIFHRRPILMTNIHFHHYLFFLIYVYHKFMRYNLTYSSTWCKFPAHLENLHPNSYNFNYIILVTNFWCTLNTVHSHCVSKLLTMERCKHVSDITISLLLLLLLEQSGFMHFPSVHSDSQQSHKPLPINEKEHIHYIYGNFCAHNCGWVPMSSQMKNNKSKTVFSFFSCVFNKNRNTVEEEPSCYINTKPLERSFHSYSCRSYIWQQST